MTNTIREARGRNNFEKILYHHDTVYKKIIRLGNSYLLTTAILNRSPIVENDKNGENNAAKFPYKYLNCLHSQLY